MRPRRYLLVDDNVAFAENVAEILRGEGAEVDVAHAGGRALELARPGRYDALVTDLRMPGMSGAQLLKAVRAQDPDVPVVLLSAWAHDAQLAQARRDGLLAVLAKPQGVPRLLEVLSRARRGGVVLVEDDLALVDDLVEVLCSRGLTVVSASSLAEVEALGMTPFAAVVDLKARGGDFGLALERVRARYPGTPALVIGAFAGAVPGVEVFERPFDTGALLARLEQLWAGTERR